MVSAQARDRLDADAVPFPFTEEFLGLERAQIAVLDRVREHGRAEWRGIAAGGLFGAAFEPGEQLDVRRLQAGPDQLDLLWVPVAQRGCGSLGKPRRDT